MAIFEVHVSTDAREAEFVPDRVSVLALFLPALWLAWHRLWFALLVYLFIATSFISLNLTPVAPAATILAFLPGLFIYLDGSGLLARACERRGLFLVDLVEAADLESAEIMWFADRENRKQFLNSPVSMSSNGLKSANVTVSMANDKPTEFGMFGASH